MVQKITLAGLHQGVWVVSGYSKDHNHSDLSFNPYTLRIPHLGAFQTTNLLAVIWVSILELKQNNSDHKTENEAVN